jgi:hypothetical protein
MSQYYSLYIVWIEKKAAKVVFVFNYLTMKTLKAYGGVELELHLS